MKVGSDTPGTLKAQGSERQLGLAELPMETLGKISLFLEASDLKRLKQGAPETLQAALKNSGAMKFAEFSEAVQVGRVTLT